MEGSHGQQGWLCYGYVVAEGAERWTNGMYWLVSLAYSAKPRLCGRVYLRPCTQPWRGVRPHATVSGSYVGRKWRRYLFLQGLSAMPSTTSE